MSLPSRDLCALLADEETVVAAGFDYGSDYEEDRVGGNVFLDRHPDDPDFSVAVYSLPGSVDDVAWGYDRLVWQIYVRGTPEDPERAYDLAAAIRVACQGLHSVRLSSGATLVRGWVWEGQATSIGHDDRGRPEYTLHVEFEITAATDLRPLG